MKKLIAIVLGCLCFMAAVPDTRGQTTNNGSALAVVIVYDASGSMKDKVAGTDGKNVPKYIIANNAVIAMADKFQEFCQSKQTNIEAGLVVFSANDARQTLPLRSFDSEAFKKWARSFRSPSGGTPLGEGIRQASAMLARSSSPKKHILVVTDGESNVGPSPQTVIKSMQENNELTPVYFVAFDINARVFEPVKALGATVVSASNEAQLRTQLDSIVGKKILLEAE